MSFFQLLYSNIRFRKLFTVESDITEIFLSIAVIMVGLELAVGNHFGMTNHSFLSFSDYIIPVTTAGWCLILEGLVKFYFWFENIWRGRRAITMFGIMAWLFIFYLAHFPAPHTTAEANGWIFIIGALANAWVYLRLGLMSDNDRH